MENVEVVGLNLYITKASDPSKYGDQWLWAVHKYLADNDGYDYEYPIADGRAATLGGALDEARGAANTWLTKDFED